MHSSCPRDHFFAPAHFPTPGKPFAATPFFQIPGMLENAQPLSLFYQTIIRLSINKFIFL